MRGGGWMHPAEYRRAATRLITDDMFGGLGIRMAIVGIGSHSPTGPQE
jgi:hypothetical protein